MSALRARRPAKMYGRMKNPYFELRKHSINYLFVLALLAGLPNGAFFKARARERVLSARQSTLTGIEITANIETAGIIISGNGLPRSAPLSYRKSGEPAWRTGHPLIFVDNGHLAGSLFNLSQSTSYEVRVQDGSSEISSTFQTQPELPAFIPSGIIYVNDDAPAGGDGSAGAPLRTIQEGLNRATPGTQILVRDGIYKEAVAFPASGAPGNWIQVKAEGSGAILDGSETYSGAIWVPYEGRKNVWYTDIGLPTNYLARDQMRFYLYDTLPGLLDGRGHNKVPMSEGWFMPAYSSRVYVRSLDDPNNHTWQAAKLNHAFDAAARDWLWIEGFEVRMYGSQDGCGVCIFNGSHIVIRKNKIHNLPKGIFIEWNGSESQGNDTRIEGNEIYDPNVNDFPWNAVKGTRMDGTAIVVRGHNGAIVRDNEIHHFFNGIYSGSSAAMENSGIALDTDIYNNHLHHIGDDALEPEGACVNNRFRNNRIDSSYVAVSLAPISQGPTWVLRNLITNYTGRAIKWDRDSDGAVLIYHNTSWTNSLTANSMDLISAVHNSVMRNNISVNNNYAIAETPTGSSGHDWNYDNWYTTRAAGNPPIKWENVNLDAISVLCSKAGFECNGLESPPGLVNPEGGNYNLLPNSPNLDRGAVIPGLNDGFSGSAPDIGAYELFTQSFPGILSITRVDPTPSSAPSVRFLLTFSEDVTGVDTNPPFTDFTLTTSGEITGAAIMSVVAGSSKEYTVSVDTGSGNGTLSLGVVDDDSIRDGSGEALGGTGIGNGNATGSESYSIEKGVPRVTGSLPTEANPSAAASVQYSVTFSEEVSGIDGSDFSLYSSGSLTGAAITEITGQGASYLVRINTGVGDGTIRLDVNDDDTIINGSGLALGGVGVGNGSYSSGESYNIDRNLPVLMSLTRMDPDPTTEAVVRYKATFSEPVSGVDTSDFRVSISGEVSGASVKSISTRDTNNIYVIEVTTGNGSGSLRLDLVDDDSIKDSVGNPLKGPGSDGAVNGESYSQYSVSRKQETFKSNGGNDGWILEASEDSSTGGSVNTKSATFSLGDDSGDRQFRVILSFPTAYLPDQAVILSAIIMLRRQGLVGTDPFNTHGNILVDIKAGAFSYGFIRQKDFQAPASQEAAGVIQNNPIEGYYWVLLNPASYAYISRTGGTQFRLRFQLEDNDDGSADYMKFYSGDIDDRLTYRPRLQIEYYVP